MSGIAGIYNINGKPADPLLLEKMGVRLAHRGLDGKFKFIRGPVGMVCQLNRITPESVNEVQPLTDSSGVVLVFDGRLDNREELLARLQSERQISKASSDPNLILAAYHLFGEQLPERLVGDYAFALFDPREQKLLLVRDQLGIRPLYYAQINGSLIFGSEIKALLVHPSIQANPNDNLFADFLLGQVYDQEITFFKDIFSLVPSHMLVSSKRGLSKRRYWDFDPSARVQFSSFQEYAEAFREIFERSVRNRLRSRHPVAVSLSGGLDSSSIYCLSQTLARRGVSGVPEIIGSSYISKDGTPSDEKTFLTDIERLYQTSIDRYPTKSSGFLDGAEEAMWHMEMPMLDEQWSTMHQFSRGIQQRGARVLLTGHWADQFLFDQSYLVDLFKKFKWSVVAAHLREYHHWMIDTDPKWFRECFILDLIKHFTPSALFPILRKLHGRREQSWFSSALHDLAFRRQWGRARVGLQFHTAHARSLYAQARTGYHVLCMEWDNKIGELYGLEMAFPFLDRDLLSFLMAIPGEMQTYQGVPKALLRQSMRDILPESISNRRWKADFTHLANESVKGDFDQVMNLIRSGKTKEWNYLNHNQSEDKFEKLKRGLSSSNAESAWDVSGITSMEMWLRVFCGERHANQDGSILHQEMERFEEVKS